MNTSTLTILGIVIQFQYTIYDPSYIEWSIHANDVNRNVLLEILLRIHYTAYIEAQLREDWFRREYEEHQIPSPLSTQDIIF